MKIAIFEHIYNDKTNNWENNFIGFEEIFPKEDFSPLYKRKITKQFYQDFYSKNGRDFDYQKDGSNPIRLYFEK